MRDCNTRMKSFLVLVTFCIFVSVQCGFLTFNRGCPRFWLVGCFGDNVRTKPALGHLLFTDRDRSSHVYSGKKIEWFDFEPYLDSLACRCAKVAKKRGYSVFGLQYYGECWGGPKADETFFLYGRSKNCANKFFVDCDMAEDHECVGRADANFVYALGEPPIGSGDGELRDIKETVVHMGKL